MRYKYTVHPASESIELFDSGVNPMRRIAYIYSKQDADRICDLLNRHGMEDEPLIEYLDKEDS